MVWGDDDMGTHVYVVKNELPMEKEIRRFLYEVVPQYKKERILQNRCPEKGDMILLGGALSVFMLQKYFGIPAEKQEIGCGAHGKPYLLGYPDVHFSISHSGKWAACAVSDRPVGIDVQEIRPFVPKVAERVCTAEELAEIAESTDPTSAFTRLWTQKEAVLKKYGFGMQGDMKTCLKGETVFSKQEGSYWLSISE